MLQFEFSDGTISPPDSATKWEKANFFHWPDDIDKMRWDKTVCKASPVAKMTFFNDGFLWKFSLDDKDDSPLQIGSGLV